MFEAGRNSITSCTYLAGLTAFQRSVLNLKVSNGSGMTAAASERDSGHERLPEGKETRAKVTAELGVGLVRLQAFSRPAVSNFDAFVGLAFASVCLLAPFSIRTASQ